MCGSRPPQSCPSGHSTRSGTSSAVTYSCRATICSSRSWAGLADLRRACLRLFAVQRCSNTNQVTSGLQHPGSGIRVIPMGFPPSNANSVDHGRHRLPSCSHLRAITLVPVSVLPLDFRLDARGLADPAKRRFLTWLHSDTNQPNSVGVAVHHRVSQMTLVADRRSASFIDSVERANMCVVLAQTWDASGAALPYTGRWEFPPTTAIHANAQTEYLKRFRDAYGLHHSQGGAPVSSPITESPHPRKVEPHSSHILDRNSAETELRVPTSRTSSVEPTRKPSPRHSCQDVPGGYLQPRAADPTSPCDQQLEGHLYARPRFRRVTSATDPLSETRISKNAFVAAHPAGMNDPYEQMSPERYAWTP